ncbi:MULTISPECIES: hypothetical protein [Pseudomonas]|uniref:hypothetical protein n=1 Tax=Pseudomonas TaxID=286 RepID=UPI001F418DDA|nr:MULTISPECIES: hypothetical protein [Pseudomonas]WAB93692.1 hypothetical protein OSS47_06805 [Pseudomonas citronellolis]
MNQPTIAASVATAQPGSRRPAKAWGRLRPGSLVPLVLGACLLLPITPSALHAKEFSMKDKQGHYQPYTPGMKLPDGVFPPMQGYTHEDLIFAAATRVEDFLKAQNVDPTLTRETLFALAAHLKAKFEEEGVEYQIASWYQKPYDDPSARNRSVERMGEDFGGAAVDAAADSLKGSPLLLKGREFYQAFIRAAGDGVHDLIVTLNKPGS